MKEPKKMIDWSEVDAYCAECPPFDERNEVEILQPVDTPPPAERIDVVVMIQTTTSAAAIIIQNTITDGRTPSNPPAND